LLQTQTPAVAQTREQKIRGGDAAADWIVMVSGNDLEAVHAVAAAELNDEKLQAMGAAPGSLLSCFRLSHAVTPADLKLT
jgi:hypothetical protein